MNEEDSLLELQDEVFELKHALRNMTGYIKSLRENPFNQETEVWNVIRNIESEIRYFGL